MDEQQNQNEAADGRSDLTAVLAAPTCKIGGVFTAPGALAACAHHGCGNRCFHDGDCEHKMIAVHVTPAIDEECDHDWEDGADGNPERCSKCGLSFMRYVHCCCP